MSGHSRSWIAICGFAVGLWTLSSPVAASEIDDLKQKIELLEAKLELAEKTIELLQKENETLRKEGGSRSGKDDDGMEDDSRTRQADQFHTGVMWAGLATVKKGKKTPWAISIATRDGKKFTGAIAFIGKDNEKIELPVSGTAPARGDGLVVIESPVIGRGKLYARGNLRNGVVALAYSLTDQFGKKHFGAATLESKK
ncbi:hypothetical protein [Thalassoroseus pseudoceratinae]|uniref:hypothetical protein n=1 Tax=Thalassoroseus pseudoceratinae TaxID=2713176 RepID=UPI0014203C4F|nr:hypothetical protein [Thalassoroseus pseudoceratinae]